MEQLFRLGTRSLVLVLFGLIWFCFCLVLFEEKCRSNNDDGHDQDRDKEAYVRQWSKER
jgi:hypothetical protein